MSTKPADDWWRWLRAFWALVFASLLIGSGLQRNLVFKNDYSVSPPRFHIVGGYLDCLPVVLIAVGALAIIFLGMRKQSRIEGAGWLLLFGYVFLPR